MADLWYYTNEGRQMEPVSTAEIQQLARRGLLKPTDMVWRDGMPRWVRASSAPELFADSKPSFERALKAEPVKPVKPVAKEPAEESVPELEPQVLDSPDSQPTDESVGDSGSRRRRAASRDEDREPRRRRRGGREKHTPIIVLLGLIIGGGLILAVMLLGMFFIIISAR
jgi:hypothetical protein